MHAGRRGEDGRKRRHTAVTRLAPNPKAYQAPVTLDDRPVSQKGSGGGGGVSTEDQCGIN